MRIAPLPLAALAILAAPPDARAVTVTIDFPAGPSITIPDGFGSAAGFTTRFRAVFFPLAAEIGPLETAGAGYGDLVGVARGGVSFRGEGQATFTPDPGVTLTLVSFRVATNNPAGANVDVSVLTLPGVPATWSRPSTDSIPAGGSLFFAPNATAAAGTPLSLLWSSPFTTGIDQIVLEVTGLPAPPPVAGVPAPPALTLLGLGVAGLLAAGGVTRRRG